MLRYLALTLMFGCGDDASRHIADAPAVACDPTPAPATCARLGPDFMATTQGANPSGPWSYGYTPTLGGAFTVYALYFAGTDATLEGLDVWASPEIVDTQGAHLPALGINSTTMVSDPIGTYTVDPGQILAHPGQGGQYSVARWTAVAAGMYRVQATFGGLSGVNNNPPTTTDVHVQHDGSELASDQVTVYGPTGAACHATSVSVLSGDTIDFAVGFGSNDYLHDSTSIDAVVCPAS
jgi:hypothetical protein